MDKMSHSDTGVPGDVVMADGLAVLLRSDQTLLNNALRIRIHFYLIFIQVLIGWQIKAV